MCIFRIKMSHHSFVDNLDISSLITNQYNQKYTCNQVMISQRIMPSLDEFFADDRNKTDKWADHVICSKTMGMKFKNKEFKLNTKL